MDDNWNPPDNGKWDRWNSSASNSSYYNQPVHKPYGRGFSCASFVLGATSVVLGIVILSLPLGALGIFFAMLVRRKGRKLNHIAKSGLALSCIGAAFGLCATIVFCLALPDILQQMAGNTQIETGAPYDAGQGTYMDVLNRYYDYLTNVYGISTER